MTYSLYADVDDEGRQYDREENEHYDPNDEVDPEFRPRTHERAQRLRDLQKYWPR